MNIRKMVISMRRDGARRLVLLLTAVLLSSFGSSQERKEATLIIGDKAPAMKVARWVKGKPVTRFEKGKIYVVEFWATWCGPCVKSIPHITELAKQYEGKVTFVGISVWEQNPDKPKDTGYYKTVEDFVKKMGNKMAYNVGIDGVDAVMAKTWMEAAGQDGIPTAFVVEKSGRVAWIGHPNQLGGVLEQVVSGKWDIKAAAERARKEADWQKKLDAILAPIYAALQKEEFKAAIDEIDKAIAKEPETEVELGLLKFYLLLEADEAAAYPYAKKLHDSVYKDDADTLNEIAWAIVQDDSLAKNPDYAVAILVAERACVLTDYDNPVIIDTLAFAHFKKGNVDKAIELQEKAVALLSKYPDVEPEVKKEITDRLERFKKKKAGG